MITDEDKDLFERELAETWPFPIAHVRYREDDQGNLLIDVTAGFKVGCAISPLSYKTSVMPALVHRARYMARQAEECIRELPAKSVEIMRAPDPALNCDDRTMLGQIEAIA